MVPQEFKETGFAAEQRKISLAAAEAAMSMESTEGKQVLDSDSVATWGDSNNLPQALEAGLTVVPMFAGAKVVGESKKAWSMFNRVDDVPPSGTMGSGSVVPNRVDDVVLNSGGDRLFDSLGSARVNQADEFNFIIDDLTSNGVEISYRKNALAYGPSASPGTPGTIVLDPDASISAIRHEYGHFLDDKALGFPPSRVYYENPSLRVASERRQYLQEISTAREVGDNSARRALIEDYLEERQYIIDNFYQTPYGQ